MAINYLKVKLLFVEKKENIKLFIKHKYKYNAVKIMDLPYCQLCVLAWKFIYQLILQNNDIPLIDLWALFYFKLI